MRSSIFILLICIILLGFGLRFYKLTESPGGLYIDEASIGYNAWSIVTTGKDEHGVVWPLFFEAFGEWKLPVYIYSVAALQYLLGSSDMTVRLPAVLFGTATIPVFALCIQELVGQIKKLVQHRNAAPLFAALSFAIAPWHIQFTHAGFEVSSSIFLFTLGLWLFLRATHTHSSGNLFGAIISLSLSLYAYNSARIVVSATGLFLFFYFRKVFSWRKWAMVFIVGLIICLPFARFAVSPSGMVRAEQISVFYDDRTKNELAKAFGTRYLRHLSPYYMFYFGDPVIADLNPHRMGWHHLLELPFFAVGLFVCLKHRKILLLLPFFILVGFIAPAITTSFIHSMRGLFAIVGTSGLIGVGLAFLFKQTPTKTGAFIFVCGWIAYVLVMSATFLTTYHEKYVSTSPFDWQVHLRIVGQEVKEIEQVYDEIYFSDGMSRITLLWELKIPPQLYHASQNKLDIGKYHLGILDLPQKETGKRKLVVTSAFLPEAQLVKTLYLPDGGELYKLWEL